MNVTDKACRDVYISGPLFTPADRVYLEQIDSLCNAIGLSTYLPHRDAGFGSSREKKAEHYFDRDLWMLKNSRCVVAVLNGADIDSGTAWEVGFSYSSGKYLLGIREDIRDNELNPMLACTLKLTRSLEELHVELDNWKSGQNSNKSAK